jgi:rhamnosyltransferase
VSVTKNSRVAAVVVTYFPDTGVSQRLESLLTQVGRLVVVDNGSDDNSLRWTERFAGRAGVTIVRNSANLGIAAALNQGLGLLASEGYRWVFTSDQDSTVIEGCISALLATVDTDANPAGIALVGAHRLDDGVGDARHRWLRPKKLPFCFERVTCERIGPEGVTLVITSGTLTSTAAFKELGPLREEFFIDMVDFEYCLRARRAGYRILVSCRAHIRHRVGAKRTARVAGVALSPTSHGPLRRYYLFRNAMRVIGAYGGSFPHWLIYQLAALIEVVLGIVFVEEGKVRKLRACLIGLWDGLIGRMGAARRNL